MLRQINVATSFDIFSLDINLGDTVGAVKAKIQGNDQVFIQFFFFVK